jgi:hypothetical protein
VYWNLFKLWEENITYKVDDLLRSIVVYLTPRLNFRRSHVVVYLTPRLNFRRSHDVIEMRIERQYEIQALSPPPPPLIPPLPV